MRPTILLILALTLVTSCGGPEEGPMGIHVGDSVAGAGEVVRFGDNWLEFSSGHRIKTDNLTLSLKVTCPHDK
ncbi:MAG: hypothetical protein HRU14_08870 [Planctomycetes bacterium]|nr:hypothetical protein [Planctomycetota bacterium]